MPKNSVNIEDEIDLAGASEDDPDQPMSYLAAKPIQEALELDADVEEVVLKNISAVELTPLPSDQNIDGAKRIRWPGPWQVLAITLMLLATTYWLLMLLQRGSEEFNSVVQDSCIVFALCCLIDFMTFAVFPELENRYVFVHFSIGMIQQLTYFISYFTDDFLTLWRPTYFGCYVYCIFMLIALPDKLFLMFRIFYTVHHTISFFITGSWMIIKDEPWNDYLIRGVMLWLTSDFYVYALNVFRCLSGRKLRISILARLQVLAFMVERIHRTSSYISAIAVVGFDLNKLDSVVLATGLANDMVDVFFQFRSILSRFAEVRRKRRSKPTQVKSMFTVFKAPHKQAASSLKLQSPFNKCNDKLLALLRDKSFGKNSQWELSAHEFQKLNSVRLQLLGQTRLFRNSLAPGSGQTPEDEGQFRVFLESVHFVGMYDLSLFDVVGVHAIGGNIVFIHGDDEQLAKYRDEVDGIKKVYCFGATELGHGSNLKAIRTYAELDIEADEWVIWTPDAMAQKYWIGNTTFVGDVVMVLARMRIGKEDYGHHWFRVPLWLDESRLHRYPGLVVRDVGVKPGCNGIGNGNLEFRGARIPRSALMGRFAQVQKGGAYSSELTSDERFLRCIQTFVLERIGVATASVGSAKAALYVALSYAKHRCQFGPPGEPERSLLSYSLHRQRLLPHAARMCSVKVVIDRLGYSAERFFKPYNFDSDRKTMHALGCMVKAFGCWDAFHAAQESRECCGGHGFAASAHVGMIRNDLDVTLTFAGDNTLLALEVVRFSLKGLQNWPMMKKVAGPLRPFWWSFSPSLLRKPRRLIAQIESILIYREETMLWRLAYDLRGTQNQFERFTAKGMEIREAARAIYDRMSVQAWLQCVVPSDLMDVVGMLDAICRLESGAAWLLAEGVLSGRTYSFMNSMKKELCDMLADKIDDLLSAMEVPPDLVGAWPLVHHDYCQRLSDLGLVIDTPREDWLQHGSAMSKSQLTFKANSTYEVTHASDRYMTVVDKGETVGLTADVVDIDCCAAAV